MQLGERVMQLRERLMQLRERLMQLGESKLHEKRKTRKKVAVDPFVEHTSEKLLNTTESYGKSVEKSLFHHGERVMQLGEKDHYKLATYFPLMLPLLFYFMLSRIAERAAQVSSPVGKICSAGNINPFRPVSLNSTAIATPALATSYA